MGSCPLLLGFSSGREEGPREGTTSCSIGAAGCPTWESERPQNGPGASRASGFFLSCAGNRPKREFLKAHCSPTSLVVEIIFYVERECEENKQNPVTPGRSYPRRDWQNFCQILVPPFQTSQKIKELRCFAPNNLYNSAKQLWAFSLLQAVSGLAARLLKRSPGKSPALGASAPAGAGQGGSSSRSLSPRSRQSLSLSTLNATCIHWRSRPRREDSVLRRLMETELSQTERVEGNRSVPGEG